MHDYGENNAINTSSEKANPVVANVRSIYDDEPESAAGVEEAPKRHRALMLHCVLVCLITIAAAALPFGIHQLAQSWHGGCTPPTGGTSCTTPECVGQPSLQRTPWQQLVEDWLGAVPIALRGTLFNLFWSKASAWVFEKLRPIIYTGKQAATRATGAKGALVQLLYQAETFIGHYVANPSGPGDAGQGAETRGGGIGNRCCPRAAGYGARARAYCAGGNGGAGAEFDRTTKLHEQNSLQEVKAKALEAGMKCWECHMPSISAVASAAGQRNAGARRGVVGSAPANWTLDKVDIVEHLTGKTSVTTSLQLDSAKTFKAWWLEVLEEPLRSGWVCTASCDAITSVPEEKVARSCTTQSSWEQARKSNGFSPLMAVTMSVLKIVGWHLSQPLAFMLVFVLYFCVLDSHTRIIGSIVAAREVVYVAGIIFAASSSPAFLLLDLRTVWDEAYTPMQGFTRLTVCTLMPHSFVALVLEQRHKSFALEINMITLLLVSSNCRTAPYSVLLR